MVAAQHRLAAEAGARILRAGGNAVDAAIATALAVGVVEPWLSGIGGGGFMLLRTAHDGQVHAIDFGMMAAQRLDVARYAITAGPRPRLVPVAEGRWRPQHQRPRVDLRSRSGRGIRPRGRTLRPAAVARAGRAGRCVGRSRHAGRLVCVALDRGRCRRARAVSAEPRDLPPRRARAGDARARRRAAPAQSRAGAHLAPPRRSRPARLLRGRDRALDRRRSGRPMRDRRRRPRRLPGAAGRARNARLSRHAALLRCRA